jgi:SAM-dependent methyltransferase
MSGEYEKSNEVDITRKTYDAIAEDYMRKLKDPYLGGSEAYHKMARERFISLLPSLQARILDVGCGFGHDLGYFQANKLNIYGADLSISMLSLARRNLPEVPLCHMDMRRLNFRPQSFGGVWAAHCLYHVPKQDIGLTISGIRNILMAQGVFFLSLKLGEGEGIDTGQQAASYSGKPRFYALYTENEARKMLRGFDIVEWDVRPEIYYGSPWLYAFLKKSG